MELVDLETEAEVFSWETSAEIADVETAETPAVAPVALRSTALEALDALALDAELDEAAAALASVEALHFEVDGVEAIEDEAAAFHLELAPAVPVEGLAVVAEAFEETALSDAEYAARCMALFDEKYQDGMDPLFYNGITEGIFALVWGVGQMSGSEEWTEADFMLLDAVIMKLEEQGLDLVQMWEEFTIGLVDKLFPDGFSADGLDAAYEGNGPISNLPEWTQLDFQAMDLVTSLLGEEEGEWVEEDYLAIFAEAFPDGIATLFPDGYSDDALDALVWGNGLISGDAEWTDADYSAFEGLWQALEAEGIEPYSEPIEIMPIEIDDGFLPFPIDCEYGFVYPMPVVIDDGYYDPAPIVIDDGVAYPMPIVIDDGCMFVPEPQFVICRLPPEDMLAI